MSNYAQLYELSRSLALKCHAEKFPMKMLILGIFFHRISLARENVSKDLMRGWRPLEQEFYVDMVKDVDTHCRPFGTCMTLDLFASAVKFPSAFRAIDHDLVVNGYKVLCGVLYEVPGGTMLVTFPQPGDWSRRVCGYIMGDADRESCWQVARILTAAFKREWERTIPIED